MSARKKAFCSLLRTGTAGRGNEARHVGVDRIGEVDDHLAVEAVAKVDHHCGHIAVRHGENDDVAGRRSPIRTCGRSGRELAGQCLRFAASRLITSTVWADASMRDIARRANVGSATLLRHFPTREALFEALLCTKLDELTRQADELEASNSPDKALVPWCREWMAFTQSNRGVVALMAAAHTNPESALHASCAAVHSASALLLHRAQTAGVARADMNGDDLFGLMAELGWLVDLPSFSPRADHLSRLVTSAVLASRPSNDVKKVTR